MDDMSYFDIKINIKVVIRFIEFSGMVIADDRSVA